jgi:5-methylthioadenosine/S-adenosylhomocysteine deaminase
VSLLIRDVILEGDPASILIRDGRIAWLGSPGTGPVGEAEVDRLIEGAGLHAFPSLRNGHTHVAMTLFRGYGDDMPLMEWLRTRIWPAEGRLTEEDVYHGARLGILEMIRGGTTFFNEMYWHRPGIVRAVEELGVRSMVGCTIIDLGDPDMLAAQQEEMLGLVKARRKQGRGRDAEGPEEPKAELALAPHSVYTVSPRVLEWIGELASDDDLLVHIHLSETEEEVQRCLDEHGCRPAELLDRLGLVDERLVAVHGQFLARTELETLAEGGATLVTNPTANLKLATGGIFPYRLARKLGIPVCLGTDGAGSNNNLDLVEEMKVAALVQKHRERDATVLPAREALEMATAVPARVFGHGTGRIEAGAPADLILVDFSEPATQPVHDPVSTLVYAASASHVHTTICAGRVLMHGRRVEVCDEEEVVALAVDRARRLIAGEAD